MAEKHWHSVAQYDGENDDETYMTHDTEKEMEAARDGFVLEYTVGFTGRQNANRVTVLPNGTIWFTPKDPTLSTVEYLTWSCEQDHSADVTAEYESTAGRIEAVEVAINAVAAIANDSGWPNDDTMRLAGTLFIKLKRDKALLTERLGDLFDRMTRE